MFGSRLEEANDEGSGRVEEAPTQIIKVDL
jgi:hypothetical protein